jgi:integrating conjugative element protein (TIGR03757 family)
MNGKTGVALFGMPVSIVIGLLAMGDSVAGPIGVEVPDIVEVFGTVETIVAAAQNAKTQPGFGEIKLRVYELDSISRLEVALSKDLTTDPSESERIVLQRMQGLEARGSARMRRAAIGLARAKHYGIDRCPAIVFNGEALVYGVTDLQVALKLYRQWRVGGNQ